MRALVRAGCGSEELRLLVSQLGAASSTGAEWGSRLAEVASFARAIGNPAARDYFRALRETRAVAALTDERVLDFARSVDRHTAEWYFWAIWGTGAVSELTDERVLRAVEFFRSIDSPATVEYFLAIRETKAAAELTRERVLSFLTSIGSEAAVEYLGALWETNAVGELTDERVLAFAESLGSDAAKQYFLAVRETKAVLALTSRKLLSFAEALGREVAADYFRALRETRSTAELTDDGVLLFAESIGKGPAREYFRVVGRTRAVGALTAVNVLKASAVVRAIGSDAALDYFLAIASAPPATSSPASGGPASGPVPDASVPVLTLLDLPTYGRYEGAALAVTAGLSGWALWQFAGPTLAGLPALLGVGFALGVWAASLLGVYLLLDGIAERSSDEFLKRRRRLLNEHGIRWHDCLAGEPRCELCWSEGPTHDDGKFDYGRFCRCPAC